MTNQNIAFDLPADTGPSFWGPGDRYTFLVTGAQTNGGYFIMEAIIPPGGGPPPHIHHREEESFYLLDGALDITLGEKKLKATTGSKKSKKNLRSHLTALNSQSNNCIKWKHVGTYSRLLLIRHAERY